MPQICPNTKTLEWASWGMIAMFLSIVSTYLQTHTHSRIHSASFPSGSSNSSLKSTTMRLLKQIMFGNYFQSLAEDWLILFSWNEKRIESNGVGHKNVCWYHFLHACHQFITSGISHCCTATNQCQRLPGK